MTRETVPSVWHFVKWVDMGEQLIIERIGTKEEVDTAMCSDYGGALEMYKKTLAIEEAILGWDDVDTAIIHNNIGV